MKETPIKFTPEMLAEIVRGKKTMTRRPIKKDSVICRYGSIGDRLAVIISDRIGLEITAIRVERVQDISEEDATKEGIYDGGCLNCGDNEPCGCADPRPDRRDSFCHLWNSIYGNWDENPWVWVIEFKRVEE